MPTTTHSVPPDHVRRANLHVVALSVGLGLVTGGAAAISGRIGLGVAFLAIMWALAGFLLIGSRHNDTIALLGDDTSEERHVHIHQRAALYSLNLLAFVIVAAFVVDVARGGDGQPYAMLGFVGGLSYTVFLLVLNRRT